LTDDFAYLNARIHARRSRLLPEGFFSEALTLGFSELIKILGETIYGPDLTGDDLADVDRAVTVHLQRTVGDLPRLVAGKTREAVNLLLMRSDLANLKIILQGKEAGWSKKEILARLGAGAIPRALYDLMAEAADAASVVQLLRLRQHPLAKALRDALSASQEPLEREVILDRDFHTMLLHRAEELKQPYLVDFFTFEIDAVNLATGLKLATLGFEGNAQRFFVTGGRRVSLQLFELLAQGEMAALEGLKGTYFAPVAEAHDLPALERHLHCLLLAKAHEGILDVLGAGVALDYIFHKEWEASRIRLLARRSFFELPASVVEPEISCP
jgi:V/A-type H+-transporting ATPase subunit C